MHRIFLKETGELGEEISQKCLPWKQEDLELMPSVYVKPQVWWQSLVIPAWEEAGEGISRLHWPHPKLLQPCKSSVSRAHIKMRGED